jgi:hypothetical protein
MAQDLALKRVCGWGARQGTTVVHNFDPDPSFYDLLDAAMILPFPVSATLAQATYGMVCATMSQ